MTETKPVVYPRQCVRCHAPEGFNINTCEVWGEGDDPGTFGLLAEYPEHQWPEHVPKVASTGDPDALGLISYPNLNIPEQQP